MKHKERNASGDYVVVMLEVDAILPSVNQLSVNLQGLNKEASPLPTDLPTIRRVRSIAERLNLI